MGDLQTRYPDQAQSQIEVIGHESQARHSPFICLVSIKSSVQQSIEVLQLHLNSLHSIASQSRHCQMCLNAPIKKNTLTLSEQLKTASHVQPAINVSDVLNPCLV